MTLWRSTPLGLLDVQCWARDSKKTDKKDHHELPIEEKESNKWLKSFKAVSAMQKRCPQTMIVSVGDRESDIYELFSLALNTDNGGKLLVRAEQKRLLIDGQGDLWNFVRKQPLGGMREIHVPRQGSRAARDAMLEVRFAKVTLKPPKGKSKLGVLTIWAIAAEEVNYPDTVKEPLKWLLLTTIEINTFEPEIGKCL